MRATHCSGICLQKSKRNIRVLRNQMFEGVTSERTGTACSQNITKKGNKLCEHVLVSVLRTSWVSRSLILALGWKSQSWSSSCWRVWRATSSPLSGTSTCWFTDHALCTYNTYNWSTCLCSSFSSAFNLEYTYQDIPLWDPCTSRHCLSRAGITSKCEFVNDSNTI